MYLFGNQKSLKRIACGLILSAMLISACACGKTENPNPAGRDTGSSGMETIESGKNNDGTKSSESTESDEKTTDKSSEKSTDKESGESTEKITEKTTEKITEKVTEKATEKTTEKNTEKTTEKTSEQPDIPTGYITETQKSGHYHNNIDAYYSGNILVCGDYAVEYFSSNKNGNTSFAESVNAFAKKYPSLNVTALLTPKACAFISPAGYANTYDSQKQFIDATYAMLDSGIKTADCASLLKEHDGEYTFYRTDHHWTSLGAYYASVAYCRANGITPKELSSYETVVGGDYVGSLYSFCADPKPSCLQAYPDHSVAHIPQTGYTMTYQSGGQTYNGTAINPKNSSYAAMFLCGDQPLTHIITENHNGKKLLVFKESYGNAFVPFMIDYYEEIVAIDFRKDTPSVAKVISDYGITDVLVINNVQSAVSLAGSLSAKLGS